MIPSVKTTHSDSSPTTETYRDELLFSLYHLFLSSSSDIPFFLFTSLHTFSHSVTCTPSHQFSPIAPLPPCFCLPEFSPALEFNTSKRQLQVYYQMNTSHPSVWLILHVNHVLFHLPKCNCQLICHFIMVAITSPSLLVAIHCCPYMQIILVMHVRMTLKITKCIQFSGKHYSFPI